MHITVFSQLRLRALAIAGAAVLLGWLVISRSFVAYLADVAPEEALWLSPHNAEAQVNLADRALSFSGDQTRDNSDAPSPPPQKSVLTEGTAPQVGDVAQTRTNPFSAFKSVDQNRTVDLSLVRTWAQSSLNNEPLDARALRIMGQLAAASNDNVNAARFLTQAATLSLHQSIALAWLMTQSVRGNDPDQTIYYADVLLRTHPEFARYVMPILAQLTKDKTTAAKLQMALAADPPWRHEFLNAFPQYVSDARIPLGLFVKLKATSLPPTGEEIGNYVKLLIDHKLYDLAYYTWLQFLPPAELRSAGLLFNGNFEVPPSDSPFNWTIASGSGVTVDVVPRPDKAGEHALLVDFQFGRVDYHSVTELLMLPPGAYHFDGKYHGDLVGPRGLTWTVACVETPETPLGESPMINGTTATWQSVEFGFTIPNAGCRAQRIRLELDARMASEQLISGSIMFDELYISRLSNPS